VWNNFVPTNIYLTKNGKNSLWEIVEACIRRELTQEEIATGLTGDKINSLIGRQLKVFVDHRVKDGKTYDMITSYIKCDYPIKALTPEEKEKSTVKAKNAETQPAPNDMYTQNINNGTDAVVYGTPDVGLNQIDVNSIPF
jgi:hypothetical protein